MPVDPTSDFPPAAARIAAAVETSLDTMVAAAVEAIWEQVPAYRDSSDVQLREDVAAHVGAVFGVFLTGMTGRRPARRADFAVTREQAMRRRAQGISLADFLQAFRIGQLTLWQGVLGAAGEDPGARAAALPVVAQIMQVIELGSTVAAEAYIEAQQYEVADSDRVRRDLLEDLLARHVASAGLKRAMLRAAGLGPHTRILVTSAVCASDAWDEHILRDAALAVGRAQGGGAYGLAVVRQDEIVGVAQVPRSVAEAYAEARVARDSLGTAAGVLALPLLSSFDYLVLREDETARRLIRPEVRRFVAGDAAAGGALIATLVEYAACDLNARTAAKRLHLHVNTAYYRLERIAERTGCDLRRLADVVELLIAVRLLGAGHPGASSPGANSPGANSPGANSPGAGLPAASP